MSRTEGDHHDVPVPSAVDSDHDYTSTTRTDWLRLLRSKCSSIVHASPLISNEQAVAPTKSSVAELSSLTDGTISLVTFILESVKDLGSNLPGIGAVGVVLSVLRKVKVI